jgi:8-oxo-dGTP pyrophosphatase MutT (NUDIX family)
VPPAVPKPAATVILLRDAPHLQVFLQRRVAGMAFAGGMTVFPGGGVDANDRAAAAEWQGRPPSWWAQRFDCDDALAAGFVRAAVRETFEECGVLLATPGGVAEDARAAVTDRSRTLDDVLAEAGRTLAADLLRPWARWVTPEESPKRYDTAFFVATAPEGQEADAQTTEAVEAAWWTPADALAEAERGGMRLMAPTLHALRELLAYDDTAAVLAAADVRRIEVVRPERFRGLGGDAVRIRDADGVEHVITMEKS